MAGLCADDEEAKYYDGKIDPYRDWYPLGASTAFASLADGVDIHDGQAAAETVLASFPNLDMNTASEQIAEAEASASEEGQVRVRRLEAKNTELEYELEGAHAVDAGEVVDRAGLQEIEPHAAGVEALHVPEAAVLDFGAVCRSLAADLEQAGQRVVTG